jgi:hypothetical protein
MPRVTQLRPEFLDEIPKALDEGVIYISIPYTTVVHLCGCGCGTKVVTPIRPHRWRLTFDGENVSLSPSIGNWSFPCQSHYWIERGRIRWAGRLSTAEITELRGKQRSRRIAATTSVPQAPTPPSPESRRSILRRVLEHLRRG